MKLPTSFEVSLRYPIPKLYKESRTRTLAPGSYMRLRDAKQTGALVGVLSPLTVPRTIEPHFLAAMR